MSVHNQAFSYGGDESFPSLPQKKLAVTRVITARVLKKNGNSLPQNWQKWQFDTANMTRG